ncbi:MAG: hypothetical protein M1819_007044 [Sarea resinae]|nr:MAG: hypothetical protein M1819_007044 [Sarea resinae]
MNSLNILSARVIGSAPSQGTSRSRSQSRSDSADEISRSESGRRRTSGEDGPFGTFAAEKLGSNGEEDASQSISERIPDGSNEKTPLLHDEDIAGHYDNTKPAGWQAFPGWIVGALTASLKWALSRIAAPGFFLVACFYDDMGDFSPLMPIRKVSRAFSFRRRSNVPRQTTVGAPENGANVSRDHNGSKERPGTSDSTSSRRSSSGSSSSMTSESEKDDDKQSANETHPYHTRSKSLSSAEEIAPARRSIRIKLYNEDSLKRRKHKKAQSTDDNASSTVSSKTSRSTPITPATLKSPTSPTSSLRLTKYPRAPAPPRPLIPPRQPSYAIPPSAPSRLTQKTLIIDLDETLIHSLAKGGRMSTGHMVEVKLNTAAGLGGTAVGPQHPILYYVHKRPHCDDFLRKVCKWYNLVVFTASVQEYADPVIDWLEQERKVFSGRYYRQHCTFRNGAYIKDISSIEPDLSKVMILDNSPMSYIFHEDNAIPIEGWINDPTDNDLLHLIPLLEGLQYVTDVRALLALRMGEAVA